MSTPGTSTVDVTVSDGNGGTDSGSFVWTVNETISVPDIVPSASQMGNAVAFSASPSGGTNPRYKWNFGDGSGDTPYSSSPAVEHTFGSPGRYAVTFTATDDSGAEVSTSFHPEYLFRS